MEKSLKFAETVSSVHDVCMLSGYGSLLVCKVCSSFKFTTLFHALSCIFLCLFSHGSGCEGRPSLISKTF